MKNKAFHHCHPSQFPSYRKLPLLPSASPAIIFDETDLDSPEMALKKLLFSGRKTWERARILVDWSFKHCIYFTSGSLYNPAAYYRNNTQHTPSSHASAKSYKSA
jgi:hypothetical protein